MKCRIYKFYQLFLWLWGSAPQIWYTLKLAYSLTTYYYSQTTRILHLIFMPVSYTWATSLILLEYSEYLPTLMSKMKASLRSYVTKIILFWKASRIRYAEIKSLTTHPNKTILNGFQKLISTSHIKPAWYHRNPIRICWNWIYPYSYRGTNVTFVSNFYRDYGKALLLETYAYGCELRGKRPAICNFTTHNPYYYVL